MRAKPASRSLRQASRTPASSRNSSSVAGGCGFPSRRMARFNTPSRSRKTARRIRLEPSGAGILEHRMHGYAERLLGGSAAGPTEAADPIRVQANHGHVPLPAAVSAGILQPYVFVGEPRYFHGQPRDLGDGDVIA